MKTEEMIAVMQAYVCGERLQMRRHPDEWRDVTSTPSWDFAYWEYRIKPQEAREWWIVIGDKENDSNAKRTWAFDNPGAGGGRIHVREVIDEQAAADYAEAARQHNIQCQIDRGSGVGRRLMQPRECWAVFADGMQQHLRMWGGKTFAEAASNCVSHGDEVVHMREVLE